VNQDTPKIHQLKSVSLLLLVQLIVTPLPPLAYKTPPIMQSLVRIPPTPWPLLPNLLAFFVLLSLIVKPELEIVPKTKEHAKNAKLVIM